jgi:hypothetical protein
MSRSVATTSMTASDEPFDTVSRLLEDFGAVVVLRAMSRALRSACNARRTEGELDAAKALRTAAIACLEQSQLVAKEGA